MLLDKKCHFFLYLDLLKIRLEITLNNFVKEKKNLFSLENTNFLKIRKIAFLPCLWSKNVYVDLVKIRLEIMLSDFPQKKRHLLDYKKKEFCKVGKNRHFSKGFNPGFSSKSQILLYLDLVIIRLEKLLSDFAEKKRNLF